MANLFTRLRDFLMRRSPAPTLDDALDLIIRAHHHNMGIADMAVSMYAGKRNSSTVVFVANGEIADEIRETVQAAHDGDEIPRRVARTRRRRNPSRVPASDSELSELRKLAGLDGEKHNG